MTDKHERILLLDDRVDLAQLAAGAGDGYAAVVALFWLAPSSIASIERKLSAPCFGLRDVAGDPAAWGREAYDLACTAVEPGRSNDGEPAWRSYLIEPLYQAAQLPALLARLAGWLESFRVQQDIDLLTVEADPRFLATQPMAKALSAHPRVLCRPKPPGATPAATSSEDRSLVGRFRERLAETRLTGDWRGEALRLLESLDKKFRRRLAWGRRRRPPHVATGCITLFSSYRNNTRLLASFATLLPAPSHWLLVNADSRRGLPAGAHHAWLWQFGAAGGEDRARAHTAVSESGAWWLAGHPLWKRWIDIEERLVDSLSGCWRGYLEQARPRLVVTANQWGIEGLFTRQALEAGVPVLQIQHGVLGGHLYTRTPILSDGLVTYGDFWRQLWPEKERRKIASCNPGGVFVPIQRSVPTRERQVTFFSWPLPSVPFYNASELWDGLIAILERLHRRENVRIAIRAHPLENPAVILDRWRRRFGDLPAGLGIGKHEPLDHVLAETDVAVMFRSTVMLNCLLSGIPVVLPGWIETGWTEPLADEEGVFAAPDFDELEARLVACLEAPQPAAGATPRRLILPPGGGMASFHHLLDDLLRRPRARG